MKQYLYSILFICAALCCTNRALGQIANAIPEASETLKTLNVTQSETYSKILKSKSWQGITIIKTPHILEGIGEGKLVASHPVLPCDNLTFPLQAMTLLIQTTMPGMAIWKMTMTLTVHRAGCRYFATAARLLAA